MCIKGLDDLIKVSQYVGCRADYVQGGGGNTSVKYAEKQMLIKASGTLLKELDNTRGWTRLSLPDLAVYPGDPCPSMESSFHAILGRCVLHSHCVYVNVLTCAHEGKAILSRLFPDALWVDYATPGEPLTQAIQATLTPNHVAGDVIIFLKNHGIIVSSEDADRAIEWHEKVTQRIMRELKLPSFETVSQTHNPAVLDPARVYFPDQVVFTQSGDALLQSVAGQETVQAYSYIQTAQRLNNLTPVYLSDKACRQLQDMDSEKFRKRMVK
jgi:rhamnose utilization protein RhaD (predicted bifunctional aldolase and dehydrogenase)